MLTLGILAGLGTAFSWACSSVIHAKISRTLGAHPFMMLRQPLASALLFILCLGFGQIQAHGFYEIFIAILSGIIGIAIADWCVYESIAYIGLREAYVCNSLSTCVTAVLGVVFLKEYLGFQGVLGILLATFGVILVIIAEHSAEKNSKQGEKQNAARSLTMSNVTSRQRAWGIILALSSAVALGLSFMWAKEALTYGINPLYLTFLRNVSASVVLWIVGIRLHRVSSTISGIKLHPELIKLFFWGCFFGPVGGIWIASVALEYLPAAVAATLIGLQPVALLLVSGIVERRVPPLGCIVGSCIACLGAAVLLLR